MFVCKVAVSCTEDGLLVEDIGSRIQVLQVKTEALLIYTLGGRGMQTG